MKVSIDTKEDSHEEIKKVIRMLQNLVGDSQEIFSNDSSMSSASNPSPISNIFGDAMPSSSSGELLSSSETTESQSAESASSAEAKEETSQSTDDLFAELFSEDELKKMETVKAPEDEDEEEEIKSKEKPKSKRPDIEFY